MPSFFGGALPLWHQHGEKQLPQPLDSLLPHLEKLRLWWRVSCLDQHVKCWDDSGGISDWVVWLWGRTITPTIPWTWLAFTPKIRSTGPIFLIPPEDLSVNEPNRQPPSRGRLRQISECLGIFDDLSPGHGERKREIWCTAWSCLHAPKTSRGTHIFWIACSSKQVAKGQAQTASNNGLYQSPSHEAQNQHTQSVCFRKHQNRVQKASQIA